MVHGCNTHGKKQEPIMNNKNQLKNRDVNIVNSINPIWPRGDESSLSSYKKCCDFWKANGIDLKFYDFS